MNIVLPLQWLSWFTVLLLYKIYFQQSCSLGLKPNTVLYGASIIIRFHEMESQVIKSEFSHNLQVTQDTRGCFSFVSTPFTGVPWSDIFLLIVLSHVTVTPAHSLSTLVVLAEDLRRNCFSCFYQVCAACVPGVSVLPYLEGLLSDRFQDALVWWRSCKSVFDSCVSLLVINLIPCNFHILAPISPTLVTLSLFQ